MRDATNWKRFALKGLVLLVVCFAVLAGILMRRPRMKIDDVTRPQTIVLRATRAEERRGIHSLTIQSSGKIDGSAGIHVGSVSNMLWHPLNGGFDFETRGDWYTPTCTLVYNPTNVHFGKVLIRYRFHTIRFAPFD